MQILESKQDRYNALVERRKAHVFPDGLLNPAEIERIHGIKDSDHLGPWSLWHGNLDAELVVVGQDWGSLPYYLDDRGRDNDQEGTCSFFRTLLTAAGHDPGPPSNPAPGLPLFFTNAVLGIRSGDQKSGSVPTRWIENDTGFLCDLLRIIQPRAVVTLGSTAYRAIAGIHGLAKGVKLSSLSGHGPICVQNEGFCLFPCFHPSALGRRNRSADIQLEDWREIGRWIGWIPMS